MFFWEMGVGKRTFLSWEIKKPSWEIKYEYVGDTKFEFGNGV